MSIGEQDLRQLLRGCAGQIDPDLGRLERALGEPLEPAAFAFGLLAAGFASNRVDIVAAVTRYEALFVEFAASVREREAVSLGPYRPGRLVGAYERIGTGEMFPSGTKVRFRAVNDGWAEIQLPDGSLRWVRASLVEAEGFEGAL